MELVQNEPATTAWFALRLGASTFGIFDVFPDEAGRQAHLSGKLAAALMESIPELLSQRRSEAETPPRAPLHLLRPTLRCDDLFSARARSSSMIMHDNSFSRAALLGEHPSSQPAM